MTTDNITESGAPRASGSKVELDLEDAPFLQDETPKKPEKAPEPVAENKPAVPDEKKKKAEPGRGRGKIFIRAGIGLGGLIILALAVFVVMSFLKKPEQPAPPPADIVEKGPQVPEDAGVETVPPPLAQHVISWGSLKVELVDPEGTIRFFECQFSFPTNDERVYIEMQNKQVVMRDSVYYYLSHQSYDFFRDTRNMDIIKKDVLNIMNDHLRGGELTELLMEKYIIK